MKVLIPLFALSLLSIGLAGCSFSGGVDPNASSPPPGTTHTTDVQRDANGNVISKTQTTDHNP
jgi:hypothetical protein